MNVSRSLDRFVEVGSHKIRYVSDGSGPAVILVHSLGGSLEWWDLTLPALARHFSVYALDLPGSGLSDGLNDEEASSEFTSRFMAGFMERLGIKRAGLVGHSMGGYVAARTALDCPDKVNGLVLVSSAGFGPIHHLILRTLAIPLLGGVLALPTFLGTRVFLRSLVYDKQFASKNRIDTAFHHFKRPGKKRDFLRALRAGIVSGKQGDNLFSTRELERLTLPTLMVWGAQDTVFPPSQAEVACRLMPDCRLHTFDKCGHIPQIEKADEFNKIVTGFLNSHN